MIVASLRESASAPANGAHWNGVHGLGTKDEIESVSRPKGRPWGSSTRSRSSMRRARAGIAATSSSVSVGWPIMKYVLRFGMPWARTMSQAPRICSSVIALRMARRNRSVPASGAIVSVRWPPRAREAARSSVRLSARSDEIDSSIPWSSTTFSSSPIQG